MDQSRLDSLVVIIENLKSPKDWASEIRHLELLIEKLNSLDKVVSVRELSKLLNKSKSWIGVSLILIKGFKLYPEIEELSNRNKAYKYIQRKTKLKRFIES